MWDELSDQNQCVWGSIAEERTFFKPGSGGVGSTCPYSEFLVQVSRDSHPVMEGGSKAEILPWVV